jgi:hypothetical protein
MTMKRDPQLEAFLEERRAVLLDGDIERLRAHLIKWGKPSAAQASIEVLTVAWHKARTGVLDIPLEERKKSERWLKEHGSSSLSDPDPN